MHSFGGFKFFITPESCFNVSLQGLEPGAGTGPKEAVVASSLGLCALLSSRGIVPWVLSTHLCENCVCHFELESTPDIWRLLVPTERNLDGVMK